jgi:RES domain-containing protein
MGDAWLQSRTALALRIPSFVIPQETNLILNPAHPEIARVTVTVEIFRYDPRLAGT